MEAAQMPISKWVGKKVMVQTYNGILLGHKKYILPFATAQMDLQGIMLSEISQSEKDKHNTIRFHLFVESKEQYTWSNKTETDS